MQPVGHTRNNIKCGCTKSLCLLDDARAVAEQTGYIERALDIMHCVASFVDQAKQRFRINVYYHTGTIGTVLDDPLDCAARAQLFRRKIKSIPEMRQIFVEPRILARLGYVMPSHLVSDHQQRMFVKILEEPSSEKEELNKSLVAIKTSIEELQVEKRHIEDALSTFNPEE